MSGLTRREFLQLGVRFGALLGLGTSSAAKVADCLEALPNQTTRVLWLQGQSCSGCSVSMLNSQAPDPDELLTQYITLLFNSTLSTATGRKGMEIVEKTIDSGDYYLAIEGSVPLGMPSACKIGERPFSELAAKAAKRAKAVVAVGSCAAFGGIPSAEGNATGAVSVPDFLADRAIETPTIRLPGCPCHPDWLVGTLVHIHYFGMPKLDSSNRPMNFYSRIIHDQCPRFADYERENFAKHFSDAGCLFKLGCLGPKTYADCPMRLWNSGTNMCIKAGSPCVGCASKIFAKKKDFPLYTIGG